MALVKSDGTELGEDKEDKQGGYVAVNNDNDNYNFEGSTAVVDKNESGEVKYENDLVKLVIHALPEGTGGKFRVVYPPDTIKIWTDSTKKTLVESDQAASEFNAEEEHVLWVEGIAATPAAVISLDWRDGAEVKKAVDRVKVVVYELVGPQNVPGLSTYKYLAKVPKNVVVGWSATGGEITEGDDTIESTVKWSAGPVVGHVKAAVEGFEVDREVNVVEVKFADLANSKLTFSTRADVRMAVGSALKPLIDSTEAKAGASKPAVVAELQVESVKGPIVDNVQRGVRYMNLGFIQVASDTERWAKTQALAQNKIRTGVFSGTGRYDLDMLNSSQIKPWYDSNRRTGNAFRQIRSNDSLAEADKSFKMTDRLSGQPVSDNWNVGGAMVVDFGLRVDFALFFSVGTSDKSNGADKRLTTRAKAAWHFQAHGAFNANKKIETLNDATSGSGGETRFTEVVDASLTPFVDAKRTRNQIGDPDFVTQEA